MNDVNDRCNLHRHQPRTIRWSVGLAIDYHYRNFCRHENNYRLQDKPDGVQIDDESIEILNSLQYATHEVIAYLNQVGRFYFFFHSTKDNLEKPDIAELASLWDELLDQSSLVMRMRNKWACHRSFDAPHGEDYRTHVDVILRMDGGNYDIVNNRLVLGFYDQNFDLHDFHRRFSKFVEWFSQQVESDRLSQ